MVRNERHSSSQPSGGGLDSLASGSRVRTCRSSLDLVGFREDWLGAGSLAVPAENRSAALTLSWDAIGIGHNHAGCVDNGRYVPADVYEDFDGRFTGVHLVLDQSGGVAERSEWHLHQDFVTTLGLTREGDKWVRPDENYIEVARLIRASDGSAALLEARASHLRDYLCARSMGLVMSSLRRRSEIIEDPSPISWAADNVEEKGEHYRWVGLRMAIHEGGRRYGKSMFVMHLSRTDVNPEDDVPVLGLPTDANCAIEFLDEAVPRKEALPNLG